MTGPSSTPRGEHTPRPGVTWATTTVGWSGEQLADEQDPPRPNRATRRAARRAKPTTA